MAKDGLIKVIEREINDKDNFKSRKEEKKMVTKRILRIVLGMLFVVVLAIGCDSKGGNPAGPEDTGTGSTNPGTGSTNPGSTSGETPAPTTPTVPDIDVSPTSLDFGVVKVGTSSYPLGEVTIKNVGTAVLKGLSYSYSVDPFYLSATDCGYELQPGEKCVMKMKFHPTTPGTKSTSLHISSNDPDEPTVVVDLQGKGFVLIVLPN